jgi:hypothetical protein
LHPKTFRSFGICFSIVKKNYRVLRFFFHVSRPLIWSIPSKKLPKFGMYYEIIPRNFVRIYCFKSIIGTSFFFAELRYLFFQKIFIPKFSKMIRTSWKFPEILWKFQLWIILVSQIRSLYLLCTWDVTLHANNSVWTRNFRGKIPWNKTLIGIFPKLTPRKIRLQWNRISEELT